MLMLTSNAKEEFLLFLCVYDRKDGFDDAMHST